MSRYKTTAQRQRRGVRLMIGLVLTAVAFAACEGGNRFGGLDPTEDQPLILSISVPDETVEGGKIDLRIEGAAARNIVQFNVRVRRAFEQDTVVDVDPPRATVTQDVVLDVPRPVQDTVVLLRVTATDAAGLVSAVREATVQVSDVSLPSVSVSVDPSEADAGEVVEITVDAQDNVGLQSVGFRVLNQDGDTIAVQEPLASNQAKRDSVTFEFQVPELEPTTLTVEGIALDLFGRAGTGSTDLVVQDLSGPVFLDLSTTPPATLPLGDSIVVTARMRDASGIAEVTFIGLALRGDPLFGNDEVVERFAPQTVQFPRPSADTLPKMLELAQVLGTEDATTSEQVLFVVRAADGSGNTAADTVEVFVGGPSIEIAFPRDGEFAAISDVLPVGVNARDETGLDTVRLDILRDGDLLDRRIFDFNRGATELSEEPLIDTPATPTQLDLVATAVNVQGIRSVSDTVTINVVTAPPLDTVPPFIEFEVDPLPAPPGGGNPRVEATDSLEITVRGRDNAGGAGLRRIGYVVFVEENGDQGVFVGDEEFLPRSISQETLRDLPRFQAILGKVGLGSRLSLDRAAPVDFEVRVHGFAADTAGVVTCITLAEFGNSMGVDHTQTTDCASVEVGGRPFYYVPDTESSSRQRLVAVRGKTVFLDNRNAVIADVAADPLRERVYLSNITDNTIEVLNLDPDPERLSFRPPVLVGSQPWGIALNNPGDTLIVANSGGTNISFVALGRHLPNPAEDIKRRLFTPNVTLFQLTRVEEENGAERFQPVDLIDFSDRPQFLTQDARGRILYSTVPTEAANTGTIRIVSTNPAAGIGGDTPEVRLLIPRGSVNEGAEDQFAIVQVDDVVPEGNTVNLISHVPGFPTATLQSGFFESPFEARDSLNAKLDSAFAANGVNLAERDIFEAKVFAGVWNVDALAMSDTTFVAASRDREWVAFGEGASAPTGRIVLWEASPTVIPSLSAAIEVTDLINNASERVLGVALNEDGSLGIARGLFGAYYFTNDLRLQGIFQEGIREGGGGAAFHPDLQFVVSDSENSTSFVGGPDQTILIVNTTHFFDVNQIPIKDNMIGPIRVEFALPGDNNGQGMSCSGLDCVVLKLFGVTESGGMLVLDVRRRDLRQ